jgi:hypothetical protein
MEGAVSQLMSQLQPGGAAVMVLCAAYTLWAIPAMLTGIGTRTGARQGPTKTVWIQRGAEKATFRACLGLMLFVGLFSALLLQFV